MKTNRRKDDARSKKASARLHRDGLALSKLGKHEQAINCFNEAVRINSRDNTAWHRKGIELNALERYDEAMVCFERAIRINRRDKLAWNHRALSLYRLGNLKDAMYCCNEAIKIDDTYPFAWYNKANIAHYLGDNEEYEKSLNRARELDPKGLNKQFIIEEEQALYIKQVKEKLARWESEGFDVSGLKEKWFSEGAREKFGQ